MELIRKASLARAKKIKYPEFKPGDTLEVSVKVKEGEKERVQVYKGICIRIQGDGMSRSFTVRKISSGIGVERSFPYYSPSVEKVKIISAGRVRKSRLFYLRGLIGKKARINSDLVFVEGIDPQDVVDIGPEELAIKVEKAAAKKEAKKAAKKEKATKK